MRKWVQRTVTISVDVLVDTDLLDEEVLDRSVRDGFGDLVWDMPEGAESAIVSVEKIC